MNNNKVEAKIISMTAERFGAAISETTIDLQGRINEVWEGLRRTEALLTALHVQLGDSVNDNRDISLADRDRTEALVALALELLPSVQRMDEMEGDLMHIEREMRHGMVERQRLAVALEALTVATGPDVSVTDLEMQAERIGAVAEEDDRFLDARDSFNRILTQRGLKLSDPATTIEKERAMRLLEQLFASAVPIDGPMETAGAA